LWLTGTTLNIQSFMGAIMAIGVAVANAILLVTFAERARVAAGVPPAVEGGIVPPGPVQRLSGASETGTPIPPGETPGSTADGTSAATAAVEGARSRLRPILMTSFAMMAGMMPMALGLGEGGEQSAPLGRAVIGGLLGATCATLIILPAILAMLQSRHARISASLDPDD